VTLEVGRCDPDAVAALLHGLPEWFGIAEEELRAEGVRYLQVKTLGPSRPDDEYERTRRFYEARGFVPLEEMFGVWLEDDPMLILVKAL